MISRLRKALIVLFMVLVMLAGAFGWNESAPSISAYQSQQVSSSQILADSPYRITCPPPPYEC